MRIVIVLLLLANFTLWAYTRLDTGNGEGVLLQDQIQPDKIKLLSPQQVAALGPAKVAALADVCVEWGPFSDPDRVRALADLENTAVFFEAPHRIRRTLGDIRAILGDIPTVIARELTKIHETFIRGPISAVLEDVNLEIGELTVVMNVGQGEPAAATPPSDKMLADEFGDMTVLNRMTRRQAVRELAKKHGTRPNDVYAAVERARKCGK